MYCSWEFEARLRSTDHSVMADNNLGSSLYSNKDSSDNNGTHINANIESGHISNKQLEDGDLEKANKTPLDEEDDEDMDALIDELESQDGFEEGQEAESEIGPGAGRVIPEDQLQTDTRTGLTQNEVQARRKKYGLNQMKESKENLILKFLGYFIGPIQFVMEVSASIRKSLTNVDCLLFQPLDDCRSQPANKSKVLLY